MARINNLTNFLTDIATAIKNKTGRNTNITPSNFDTEILSIASDLGSKNISISSNGTNTYQASNDNLDGYSSVAITTNVQPTLQSKTISPTTSSQTISADNNYDGLSQVTINAVTNSIDSNITAGNIKKDVSILGITGTYDNSSSLGTKTITSNGTYNASSDNVDGYSSVTVNVPSSGTSSITKTPITANDFTQTMEQKGYTVTDNTSRYSSISWVQTVLNVTDSSWSIDFYVLDTIERTRSLYNNNVSTMEYLKNDGDVETVEAGYICSKHTLTSSSSYTVASTIDNTMIYVSSGINSKSEIDGILNDIGY